MQKTTFLLMLLVTVSMLNAGCSTTRTSHKNPVVAQHTASSNPQDVPGYRTIMSIDAEDSKTHSLTTSQIATLNSYINSPYIQVRVLDISTLCNAGSAHASEAAVVARKGLTSPDSLTRLFALRALDYLHAPDAVRIAHEMLSDPSGNVEDAAKKIIKTHQAAK